MKKSNRKLVLYIAASLDGFIAAENDDLSFLEQVHAEGQDYGYGKFIETVDAVILGNRTYSKVLSMGYEFPHKDKESYIITRNPKPSEGNIHFFSGELSELVSDLKTRKGKNIFCDGGAFVVNALLKYKLIDEIILSIIPVVLGNGIRLFEKENPLQKLELLSSKSFDSGLVQLHYKVSEQLIFSA